MDEALDIIRNVLNENYNKKIKRVYHMIVNDKIIGIYDGTACIYACDPQLSLLIPKETFYSKNNVSMFFNTFNKYQYNEVVLNNLDFTNNEITDVFVENLIKLCKNSNITWLKLCNVNFNSDGDILCNVIDKLYNNLKNYPIRILIFSRTEYINNTSNLNILLNKLHVELSSNPNKYMLETIQIVLNDFRYQDINNYKFLIEKYKIEMEEKSRKKRKIITEKIYLLVVKFMKIKINMLYGIGFGNNSEILIDVIDLIERYI